MARNSQPPTNKAGHNGFFASAGRLSLHSLLVNLSGLGLIVLVMTVAWLNGTATPDNNNDVAAIVAQQPTITAEPRQTTTPAGAATAVATVQTPTPLVTVGQAAGTPMFIGDEYLALGDSIGYGLGAPSPTQQGYAGVFYNNYLRRVKPDLLNYRNLAVSGETSTSFFDGNSRGQGRSQYERMLQEFDDALAANRKISPITLTLGGNDMLDARNKTAAEKEQVLAQFETNFSRVLDELKTKADPQATIFVSTYYNPYAYYTGGGDEETAWVKRFNATISRLAAARGMRVADFFTPIFHNEEQLTWIRVGDIHPTREGHALLAQTLWQLSNYDRQGAVLSLSYSPLTTRPLQAGQRLAFKLAAQDNLVAATLPDVTSAGTIVSASVRTDNGTKTTIAPVPIRYRASPTTPEFSYVLDTRGLAAGNHTLRFEATDSAGLTSSLEVTFEIGG